MGTLALFLGWGLGVVVAATGAIHAIIFALSPLLVRLLPDDMFGPGGMYVDTRNRQGIFDTRWFTFRF